MEVEFHQLDVASRFQRPCYFVDERREVLDLIAESAGVSTHVARPYPRRNEPTVDKIKVVVEVLQAEVDVIDFAPVYQLRVFAW